MYKVDEPDTFEVLVFGDPQPRNDKEIGYIRDDVVAEVITTKAKLGIAMGDIMYDDLSLFDRYNSVISQIGIPFYNVPGNHDRNYDASDDAHSLETFKYYFGPAYYSFEYGKVHFIILDDVVHFIDNGKPKLYETDPTGIYFQYKACVIGEAEPEVEEILNKEYKENMKMEDGFRLAIKALKKSLDKNFDPNKIDAAYVSVKNSKFRRLKKDEIKSYMKK